jgi:NitT/TauT family transport system substrate-binding protein
MSRGFALVVAVLVLATGVAEAQDKVKVGVLKLSSSAVLFVGVEKGFFKEFGVEPELVFFQAAAPIATALAAGQVEVGATGLTAALNIVLGGEKLWIVADKGREWPGSTFHYHLGDVLEKHGLTLNDVKIVPLQAMGAAREALKGKQVEAIMLPQPFPGRAEADGFGKILAWGGDLFPWQTATVFYSNKFANDKTKAVNFMKGYVKSSRYYFDAVLVQKGGRLWVADIDKQMTWWHKHGFMKSVLPLEQIVDTSFVEAAVRAVAE